MGQRAAIRPRRAFWLCKLSEAAGGRRFDDIVDLGCGTGRYSEALARHFGARVVGVDPSRKMLARASENAGQDVSYVLGRGEAVPLPDATADLVFMSMVFHHFEDPDAVARECWRLLRADGMVMLRGLTAEQIDRYPFVQFFPQTRQLMAEVLLPASQISEIFVAAGFEEVRHDIIERSVAANWRAYEAKLAQRAYSFLAQLTDDEFAAGMAQVKQHAKSAEIGLPVVEPVDLFVFRTANP